MVGSADDNEPANSIRGQAIMGGSSRDGQEEGAISPEDEYSPRCGSALAPRRASLGELGRHPSMIVRQDDGVHGTGQDVVS